ncbi:MAG TPA: BlaI/MecI/CopY family transcriptional regulator [bacterium]|nr:BlaI/MecI/CopY family transcriptional regulator [bacterium]HQL62159.1 BlaI/MecI/CopY family transcriptional regulator [bacterium]
MQRRKQTTLQGELETMVMKEVWRRGRATVHEVRDSLSSHRKPAYTTILTTLRNLERKGFLDHELEGRSYVYIPKVDQETVARSLVRDLLNRLFEGSPARMVNALFEEEGMSMEQFETLRREILDWRKQEKKDG